MIEFFLINNDNSNKFYQIFNELLQCFGCWIHTLIMTHFEFCD
jgi:hypothetical protein